MTLYVGNGAKVTRPGKPVEVGRCMARRAKWTALPLGLMLCATPAAAQGPLTKQDPASAQPTLPKPMPDLTVPGSGSGDGASKKPRARLAPHPRDHHRRHARGFAEPLERPALANVELVEPLPHPPQPPHVTVPVPAYPLENFVTYFTTPPPPVVCRPTRRDRFKPDLGLVDERPVLCTADNP